MSEIPWPPSVNTYWRIWKGRILVSKKGREYRRTVAKLSLCYGFRHYGKDRLRVTIYAHPPDKRRRDMDNLFKAPLDALQAAVVYVDDSQIDDLRIVRCDVAKPGCLKVKIEVIPDIGV